MRDVRYMAPDASRCPDDVRMSESGKQVSTCFSYMHVQSLMNSLWNIRIFLGLVPTESHCTKKWNWNPGSNTHEPGRSQRDRPAACVIVQQYSSATLLPLRFHSPQKKKNSAHISIFFSVSFYYL